MRILALDLGTKTGWALWDGVRIESGVQDFSPQRGESKGMRYLYFNRWLRKIALYDEDRRNIDLIWYEQNFRRGGFASEVAAGFSTRVHELCASHAIEYGQLNAMTLKKWATGSGKASKGAMVVAAIRKKYELGGICIPLTYTDRTAALGIGEIRIDDNEADAILLLGYALERFGGGTTSCNVQPARIEEKPKLPAPSMPTT